MANKIGGSASAAMQPAESAAPLRTESPRSLHDGACRVCRASEPAAEVHLRVVHALSGELLGEHVVGESITIGRVRCQVQTDLVRAAGQPTRGRVALFRPGSASFLEDACTLQALPREGNELTLAAALLIDVVDGPQHFRIAQPRSDSLVAPEKFFRRPWFDNHIIQAAPGITEDHLFVDPEGKAFVFSWWFEDMKVSHAGEPRGMRWQCYTWHVELMPASELPAQGGQPHPKSDEVVTVVRLTVDRPPLDNGPWPEEILFNAAHLRKCRLAPGSHEQTLTWTRWTAAGEPFPEAAEISSAPPFLPHISPRHALRALFLDFFRIGGESRCWSLRQGTPPHNGTPVSEIEDSVVFAYNTMVGSWREQAIREEEGLVAAFADGLRDLGALDGAQNRGLEADIGLWRQARALRELREGAAEEDVWRYCRAAYWQPWTFLRQNQEAVEQDKELREDEETRTLVDDFVCSLKGALAKYIKGHCTSQ